MGTLSSLILLITLSKVLLLPAYSTTYWQDIEALKEFKNSIEPNSVSPSMCLGSWDFSVDPCDHVFSDKFTCGLSCSSVVSGSSRVTEISLDPDANYSGTIPESIGSLSYLQTLNLEYNSFSGSIPRSISNLTRLTKLTLSHNSLSGSIPDSIGSLALLEELCLDYNNLEGTIPISLDALKSLKRLEIQNNRFVGEFPELSQLESLYYLDASNNSFSGELPARFPPSLVELVLRNNRIHGNVPSYVCSDMVYLQVLDLSHNRLTGPVPAGLFTHPSLQQLPLCFNNFGSVESPSYSGLGPELIAVDLSNNNIHGLLPAFIGQMPKLSSLSFENNKLSGFIPTTYALKAMVPGQGMAQFERLLLGGNYLYGPIPSPFISSGIDSGSVTVRLGDNCLYRCPVRFFFCEGGVQKSLEECKSFVPVIP